jgi:peptidoglycan/xylan/chitin deacetylase (PgdA/CDA1 family)
MLRQLARNAIYRAATWEPLFGPVLRRQLSGKAVVLMYHEVASDNDDIEAWTVVKQSDFVRQMDYLRTKFDVVSLSEATSRMANPNLTDRPMAVVTFDDGDRGNRDVLLPIAESLELPVTIFVATRQVQDQRPYWFDRLVNALQFDAPITVSHPALLPTSYVINETSGARNWANIQKLLMALKKLEPVAREQAVDVIIDNLGLQASRSRGIAPLGINDIKELSRSPWVTIGAHSHCHNILTQLDRPAALESVVRSKELLELWTGGNVNYFAYPNGDYNDSVISAVVEAGFEAAVTTAPRPWESGENHFALPRIGVGRYDSLDVFKVRVVGGMRRFLN